jgi:hypothetical protein
MSNTRVSIVWNGTAFVLSHTNANGISTTLYSVDGENWENTTIPSSSLVTNEIYNVKWNGNRVLLLGNVSTSAGNVSLTSTDGLHYGITKPSTANGQLYDMELNSGFQNTLRFPYRIHLSLGVALPDSSETIAYSLDSGNSWVPAPSSAVYSLSANDAKWNGRSWVSVGSGQQNTIATSTDGIYWIGRGINAFSNEGLSIDWSKEQCIWVAAGNDLSGNGSVVAHSVDGVHWISQSISGMLYGNSVKWNGEMWVLAGVPSVSGTAIAYSTDGKTWSSVPNIFANSAARVDWNGTYWTVYGDDPSWNIATSSDGIHWQTRNDINATAQTPYYDGLQFWESSGNTYSVSIDGTSNFSRLTADDMSLNEIYTFVANTSSDAIATIMPITVATGEGKNTLSYSHDGIFWIGLGKTIFSERANHAVWNGRIWVAVGKGGWWVATSYDGIEWQGRDSALFEEGYDVAWNGTRFVAVGKGNLATIATSDDGIYWKANTTSLSLFSEHASKIMWTGKKWLAYGSGGNTTAMSTDGLQWNTSLCKNATIMDASSVLRESGYFTDSSFSAGGCIAYSSSQQSGYESYRAYDNSGISQWQTGANTYATISGVYLGTESTEYTAKNGGLQTASGERIDLYIPVQKQIQYYAVSFRTDISNSNIPRNWVLLGSNNQTTWVELDTFSFQYPNPPNNTWKIPRFTSLLSLYDTSGAFSFFRFIALSTFGGTTAIVNNLDFFTENPGTTDLSRYQTPIVLRNSVLFMSNIVSVSGVLQPVYHLADTALTTLAQTPVNGREYVNSTLYGVTNPIITSVCFDGETTFLTDISGGVVAMTNDSANRHLNTDISMNGYTIDSGLSTIYSSCWNQRFVLFAGTGGISYGCINNAHNQWSLTNAGDLFTHVYGVSSNSGYGFVYIQNAMYLHSGEVLKLVGPAAQSFAGDTDIHFNLHNSNKK